VCRDAIKALERAVDVRQATLSSEENTKFVLRKKVPVEMVFRGGIHTSFDAQLDIATPPGFSPYPELGDRVVSLVAEGVPFGLRGTVIAIHTTSAFVEVRMCIFLILHILLCVCVYTQLRGFVPSCVY
jgi:hypothetical protein